MIWLLLLAASEDMSWPQAFAIAAMVLSIPLTAWAANRGDD